MRTTITTMLAVASVCATSVHGQVDNCVELLRLSRTTSRTVVDRSQFTRTVNNVCDEIRRARSENRSLNLNVEFMGLGLGGGGSNATTDSLYTKYCSDQSAEQSNEFNYQQYLDGLEPGAYAAYQACKTAASNGVQFQMLTSPTRGVLELVVFNRTIIHGTQAVMSWSASDPVTCQWESFSGDGEVEASRRRALRENERTRLKCRRDSYNTDPVREPDFINVIRDGGNAVINVPWLKYSEQGVPYQTLEEIRRQTDIEIAGLRNEVQSITSEYDELRSNLEVFRTLERLPLRQRIDGDPGYWGTWRQEASCPERHYVCGLQQRIEPGQGDGDDSAMNGLRMFCCPLFDGAPR